MQQQALKNLSDRFNSLSMPNPVKCNVNGRSVTINHPFEFLLHNFPTFDDFYAYFVELAPFYTGELKFITVLHSIYYDLRDIAIAINSMKIGYNPPKLGRILESMQLLSMMAQKKAALCNAKLAQEYKNKSRKK